MMVEHTLKELVHQLVDKLLLPKVVAQKLGVWHLMLKEYYQLQADKALTLKVIKQPLTLLVCLEYVLKVI